MTFSDVLLTSFFHQFMCSSVHSSIYSSLSCSHTTVPLPYSIELCTCNFILIPYLSQLLDIFTCPYTTIQVHIYMYPIYVHVLMESCTFFRYELKMAVTDSVFVIYSQAKVHPHIPQKALRVRKYFILIGHVMSYDYYIIRGAMW